MANATKKKKGEIECVINEHRSGSPFNRHIVAKTRLRLPSKIYISYKERVVNLSVPYVIYIQPVSITSNVFFSLVYYGGGTVSNVSNS